MVGAAGGRATPSPPSLKPHHTIVHRRACPLKPHHVATSDGTAPVLTTLAPLATPSAHGRRPPPTSEYAAPLIDCDDDDDAGFAHPRSLLFLSLRWHTPLLQLQHPPPHPLIIPELQLVGVPCELHYLFHSYWHPRFCAAHCNIAFGPCMRTILRQHIFCSIERAYSASTGFGACRQRPACRRTDSRLCWQSNLWALHLRVQATLLNLFFVHLRHNLAVSSMSTVAAHRRTSASLRE